MLGAVLAAAFVRLLVEREAAGTPGPYSEALSAGEHPMRPSNRLTELERSLDLATISAGDAHHVLRPLVVNIAGTWLEGTYGFGLDDRRAATLLPADVWALASPDRAPTPRSASARTDAGRARPLISHLEALR